ncbi:MAG: nitrile hydratase subunit alpha [Alphaproteobacteria bacterium]|jgi:nitrile hydratase subunit alpha|nr:nitrile hydratase subunit alpha [Rhodospirillaceae bacterium]MBT6511844.1 nitrile hydratase subunit alpha [Rhodospirillaceae bacterium]MBT7615253.1 nitrile hydratase subunit alpha [Rhodospirillaceae bacterium]MBT7646030.1 nitrile hydratase subunit alpha [Rhodospirillaceae bacterium]MDG2479256.1 nitrile hydratase subunit alpha [Alphaproteobacteria bacterium]
MTGHRHNEPESDIVLRVKAMEQLLTEKGIITAEQIDLVVDHFETKVGPRNGAKVVARAWSDADYKKRLLSDASPAIAEVGFSGMQGEDMVVLENTPEVHNVVVCTLCSCYPWPVLGLPPAWFKSPPYRARVVREPRAVLAEFGVDVGDDVEVRVWDSSAEIRYMVLPMQPDGTEELSTQELAEVVTRDGMIGVASV